MSVLKKVKFQVSPKQKKIWAEFGAYLKTKRFESGLSKMDVAQYLGVSRAVLESYENGDRAIPLNRIYALANCLNIAPEELMRKMSVWEIS